MVDLSRDPLSRRALLKIGMSSAVALPTAQFLAACGGGGQSTAGKDVGGSLTYISGPNNDKDQGFKDALASAFTKEHKDVKVRSTFFDWETMDADLTAAYAGDAPPDVAYLVSRAWPQYAAAGALADLTERVKSPGFKASYDAIPEEVWAAVTRDGKIWGVPYLGAVFPVYVNESLIKKAGVKDWRASYDAMFDAARAVRRGDTYGFSIGQTQQEAAFQDLGPYIHNAGGALLNEDGTGGNLDLPEVAAAFELIAKLHAEDLAPRPGLYDGEAKAALFKAGRVGIAHGSVALAGDLSTKQPDFDWSIAMAPRGPVAETAYGDFGFLCIAAKSENQDAAWEYVQYLTSPEPVVQYVKDTGRTLQAVRTDVADDIFPEGDSPAKQLQTEFLPHVKSYTNFPKQVEALRALVSEYELVIRGKKSGADAIAAANETVNRLVA